MNGLALAHKKELVIAVLLYIGWVVLYTYIDTNKVKTNIYQQLDRQLVTAALTAPMLLPKTLHHQTMVASDLSSEQDIANRFKLSEYTDSNDVIYIYTLILRDDKVYFTSSSATPEERQSAEMLSDYFDPYDDVDPRVFEVFNKKQKTFLEYTDQWGTFRSVFIPAYAEDGTFYLTAADLSISHIEAVLSKQIYRSLIFALLFLLFIYPLYKVATKRRQNLLKILNTKVKQKTQQLFKSENRLKRALISANQAWFEVDVAEGQITVSDDFKIDGFGDSKTVFPIEEWLDNIHPDDVEATNALFNSGLKSGKTITMIYRVKSSQDEWIWLQSTCEVVEWDKNKKPLMMIGINTDITEQKLEEESFRNRQQQIIQDHKMLLVLGKDSFPSLMEAFNEIAECSAKQLNIARVSVWFLNDENTMITCKSLYFNGTVSNVEMALMAKDYPDYFRLLSISGFISADDARTHPATSGFADSYLKPLGITSMLDAPILIKGKMIGIVCLEHIGQKKKWSIENEEFARSIADLCAQEILEHERKQAEAELKDYKQDLEELVEKRTADMKKARDEAEQANMAKSDFLSSMSHELRTPMNSILGFSQLLEHDPKHTLTLEQTESVRYIKESGKHLLELINDVLDLAKIEAGNLDVKFEDVEVERLFDEIIVLIKAEAEKTSISLVKNVDKHGIIILKADYRKLKQVLLNFASNGIKYNNANGAVSFSAYETEHGTIRINVSDTGKGIAEESYSALFEPFNRLDMTNSNIPGTGIGLTICKQLVELMNGQIGVYKNQEGRGLTFWVEFEAVDKS